MATERKLWGGGDAAAGGGGGGAKGKKGGGGGGGGAKKKARAQKPSLVVRAPGRFGRRALPPAKPSFRACEQRNRLRSRFHSRPRDAFRLPSPLLFHPRARATPAAAATTRSARRSRPCSASSTATSPPSSRRPTRSWRAAPACLPGSRCQPPGKEAERAAGDDAAAAPGGAALGGEAGRGRRRRRWGVALRHTQRPRMASLWRGRGGSRRVAEAAAGAAGRAGAAQRARRRRGGARARGPRIRSRAPPGHGGWPGSGAKVRAHNVCFPHDDLPSRPAPQLPRREDDLQQRRASCAPERPGRPAKHLEDPAASRCATRRISSRFGLRIGTRWVSSFG